MRNIPHCCLPQESGPCLSPGVGDHPLRSPTRHRHGEPLPRHPADGPQPPPKAPHLPVQPFASPGPPGLALSRISRRFQRLSRSSGQVSYVLRTRAPLSVPPKRNFPFDLHVLGTPPTFILSQDQTRRLSLLLICTSILSAPVPGPKPVAPAVRLLPTLLLSSCVQSPLRQPCLLPKRSRAPAGHILYPLTQPPVKPCLFARRALIAPPTPRQPPLYDLPGTPPQPPVAPPIPAPRPGHS